MNNELQKHKIIDAVKWLLTLIAFILIAVMLTGIILGWFDKKEDKPIDKDEGEVVATLPESDHIQLSMKALAPAEYETYGVSAQSANVFTITATARDNTDITSPSYNYFDWSMAWATADSKTLSDYVKMTASDNLAAFTCVKPFNTQIIVTCTSALNPEIKATATLDYARVATGFTYRADSAIGVSSSSMTVHNGEMQMLRIDNADKYGDSTSTWDKKVYFYEGVGDWGEGTINDMFTLTDVKVALTSGARSALATAGASGSFADSDTVTFTPEQVTSGITVKTLLNTGLTFNTDSQSRRVTIMNALKGYTGNVYTVKITGECATRGTVTCTLNMKLNVAAVTIKNVSLDKSGLVF